MTTPPLSTFPFSFLGHNEKEKKNIRRFTNDTVRLEKNSKPLTIGPKVDSAFLHQNRDKVALNYALHQQQIQSINPALFPFQTEHRRKAVRDTLTMTIWAAYLQYRLDDIDRCANDLSNYAATINQCQTLLFRLDHFKRCKESPTPNIFLENETAQPIGYLGVLIGPWIVALIMRLKNLRDSSKESFDALIEAWHGGKTRLLIDWMSELNGLRLYWVWGSSLLDAIFSLAHHLGKIDKAFFNQLEGKLQSITPLTGNLGWILYYARFSISLILLLEHALPHPDPTKREQDLPWQQRLGNEWHKRKYQLLNDSIWATANLVCFFWLTYRKTPRLGLYGDYLTALLLVMDVTLTMLRIQEEEKKHQRLIKDFEVELQSLEDTITQLTDPDEIAVYKEQRALLEERIHHYQLEWRYQKLGLYNDLLYAVSLLLAFGLLIGLFVPGGQIATPAMVLVGAIACFTLTVLFNAMNHWLPIQKSKEELSQLTGMGQIEGKYQMLLSEFNQTQDETLQKKLYVQLMDMEQQIISLQKNIRFQTIMGLRGLIIESITPVVVLVSMMVMPVGLGIAILSGAFILAVASKCAINGCKPEDAKHCDFDKDQFRLFKQSSEIPAGTENPTPQLHCWD